LQGKAFGPSSACAIQVKKKINAFETKTSSTALMVVFKARKTARESEISAGYSLDPSRQFLRRLSPS
jgi:hypothetical protein